MNENKVTINEMIVRMVAEARRLGYSESSIWTNIQPGLRAFAGPGKAFLRGICPCHWARQTTTSTTLKTKNHFPPCRPFSISVNTWVSRRRNFLMEETPTRKA